MANIEFIALLAAVVPLLVMLVVIVVVTVALKRLGDIAQSLGRIASVLEEERGRRPPAAAGPGPGL